jgi:hypothetical protein
VLCAIDPSIFECIGRQGVETTGVSCHEPSTSNGPLTMLGCTIAGGTGKGSGGVNAELHPSICFLCVVPVFLWYTPSTCGARIVHHRVIPIKQIGSYAVSFSLEGFQAGDPRSVLLYDSVYNSSSLGVVPNRLQSQRTKPLVEYNNGNK